MLLRMGESTSYPGSAMVDWLWHVSVPLARLTLNTNGAVKAHDVVVLETEPPPKVWWGA
jgi:hypothetical protein